MSDGERLVFRPAKVSWATSRFVEMKPPLGGRAFLYAVLLFAAAGLAYSAFAVVAVSVDAPGVLTTREQSFPITAPFNGRVKRLTVRENDRVNAGDVLVESDTLLDEVEVRLVRSQKKLLDELIARDSRGPCADCAVGLRTLAASAFHLDNREALRQPLAECRQLLLDLVAARDRLDSAWASSMSARRRIALAEQKLAEIRRRGAEQLLDMQVEQLRSEVVAAQAELADRKQGAEGQLVEARNRLRVRLAELDKALERNQAESVVTAPGSGIVSELRVSGEGQQVQVGQQLMLLLPADSGLVADLFVANRDISQVKPGLLVRVKLDALPEREFGSLTGTVEQVAASTRNERDPGGGPRDSSYRVRVVLERQSLTKDGVERPFRMGMSLTGVVVTHYETLLWRGLKKVFNLKDQALGESPS